MPEFDITMILQYLPWIITGVFALGILTSILFGLKRGAFKGTFRFITILFSFFVALFFAGTVSQFIIDFDVSSISFVHNLVPDFTSVSAFISGAISSMPEIADLMSASPAFSALVAQFPLLIANIFVFMLIFYTLKFLTWFVYAIVSAIVVGGKKKKVREEQKAREVANGIIINYYESGSPKKSGRDRGWGALMGLAQGFVLALVFFLPFSGVVNTYFDVRGALESEGGAQAYEAYAYDLDFDLDEIIPAEIHNFFVSYRASAPSVVFGFLNVDRMVFDYVSSITVDGKRVVLANEIRTIANVFADIKYFLELDFDNIDLETFDFDRLEQVVNNIFNSDVFKIIAPEVLNYYGLQASDYEDTGDFTQDQLKAFIPLALGSVTSDTLKSDILAIISTAKAVQTAGIFGAIKVEEQEMASAVIECLTLEHTTSIFNAMLTSQTLRQALVFGLNLGFEFIDEELGTEITPLVFEDVVWTNVASSLANLVNSVVTNDLAYDAITGNLDMENPDYANYVGGDYLLADFGRILDIAKSNPLLSDSISKVILSFSEEEFANYIDLATFASASYSFETEFAHLDNVLAQLNLIKDIEDNTLFEIISAGDVDFEEILALLNDNIDHVKAAVNELLSIQIFQASADKLFNLLGDIVAETLEVTVPDVDLTGINWTDEKTKFETIIEKAIAVMSSIDMTAFENGVDYEAISAHLEDIGEVLDVMRDSVLLSGIYDGLVEYLQTNEEISEFVNFDNINNPDFSWQTEFRSLATVINVLNDNELLEGFGSGSIEDVLQGLGDEDVQTIVEAIVESELLSGLVVTAVNEMIGALNETEGVDIGLIPEDIDLSEQTQEIVNVFVAILPMIDLISGNDVDIETLNPDDFGAVLDALADSYVSEGIFAGIYEEVVDFILADPTYGAQIDALYDENDVANVDWASILNTVLGI